MKKTIERNLLDIILAILLFVSIALAVHSCISCKNSLEELRQSKEYEIPNIRK